jgi:HEPN domain-containing protein
VNRADWQEMAEEKLLAAQSALAAQLWSSAYHLSGLAVELGLKACILARLLSQPEVVFDKRFHDDSWTHDFTKLVGLAELRADLDTAIGVSPSLRTNWTIACAWRVESRYAKKEEPEAQKLFDAISDPSDGVLQWIKAHW